MTSPALDQKALAAALTSALQSLGYKHGNIIIAGSIEFDMGAAVRAAISTYLAALPAPEPVAWLASARKGGGMMVNLSKDRLQEDAQLYSPTCFGGYDLRPLYASPPSHQGLREALEKLLRLTIFELGSNATNAPWAVAIERARAALQSQPAPSGETK